MKKIILASIVALSFSAFAQTETPAATAADTSHSEDTIKKTDEKPAMPMEKHKSHKASKKHHGKKHHAKKHKKVAP